MSFEDFYIPFITGLLSSFFEEEGLAGTILLGQYGVLTMTPAFLLGVLLPLVVALFLIQHLLADSGLLQRIARLLDKPFHLFGLSGNAIIPILLGFGCVTVALVSVNMLGTKKERLIAAILLCIAVPCSAQVAVIIAMSFLLDFKYLLLYYVVILSLFFLLGAVMNLLLPGMIATVPAVTTPLKRPNVKAIIKKTALEARDFLRESGLPFFIGSIIISVIDYYDGFFLIRKWFDPITAGLLNLPQEATNLFILSIVKRDLGAMGFYSMVQNGHFTQPEIVVTLIVLTLFVPCFASQVLLFKNQKPLPAILIWIGSFAVAFAAGAVASAVLL